MKIINNTKDFYPNSTKNRVRVQDSRSSAYRNMMSDYWLQRIYYTFKECDEAGGKVVFLTFTYNDRYLPKYNYISKDGSQKSFPCFSKKDKDRFLNSLFKRWERVGITGKTCDFAFKYVWANEYAQNEHFSCRPHYHVLLYLPKEILAYESFQASKCKVKCTFEDYLIKLFNDFWSKKKVRVKAVPYKRKQGFKLIREYYQDSLGLVMSSPDQSIFVNSEFACMYVSKYMFKDESFLMNSDVKEYYEEFGKLPDDGKRKGQFTSHWQSQHFGESLVSVYSVPEYYLNGFDFHFASEVKSGKSVKHRCPTYIDKKISYDYDKDKNLYRLNVNGVLLRKLKFPRSFKKDCDRISRLIFNDSKIRSYLKDVEFWNDDNLKLARFGSIDELLDYIHNVDSRNFVEELVLYNRVWEGLLVDESYSDLLNSCTYDEFYRLSLEQYEKNIAPHLDCAFPLYHCELGVFKGGSCYHEVSIFNDNIDGVDIEHSCFVPVETLTNRFDGYSQYLDIIGEIQSIYVDKNYKKHLDELKKRKKGKAQLNPLPSFVKLFKSA